MMDWDKMSRTCDDTFFVVKITGTKGGKTFEGYFDRTYSQLYPMLSRRLNAAKNWAERSSARGAATKIGKRKWVDAWGFEWEDSPGEIVGLIRQIDIQKAEVCKVKITWEIIE